ncbi:XRE family transcriptional regulator [Enterococcus sp. JM4C]|uniref:helix-turn-helix domain-containing protein n=1 Tax=Candidatus Enterococcus huntleyi TaxID=1857217 RepID=UPI00137A3A3D|nr:helix-turn-helix transcriptional regulator [Enterococcus sp. JM4C]KAF1299361.1 XRE family transcriptional regulator [Enterococcus sp. JM4C]
MDIGQKIKSYRVAQQLTQKKLGEQLNVSDKTVSSWENNRTYPDISMMMELAKLFDISVSEFLESDTEVVEKIDKDLKLKTIYQAILIIVGTLLLAGAIFFKTYQYKNEAIDSINPFLEMKVGYATLPAEVTYNGGHAFSEEKDAQGIPQYPDPYKNIPVIDDVLEDVHTLTFEGGQAPEGQNYAMVQHKGSFVRRIYFVDRDAIPLPIRNALPEEYEEILPN